MAKGYIRANVIVFSGVTIGQDCVIDAGSIAAFDCEDNYLYVGVPAKKSIF